jgi:hypothetical protein
MCMFRRRNDRIKASGILFGVRFQCSQMSEFVCAILGRTVVLRMPRNVSGEATIVQVIELVLRD